MPQVFLLTISSLYVKKTHVYICYHADTYVYIHNYTDIYIYIYMQVTISILDMYKIYIGILPCHTTCAAGTQIHQFLRAPFIQHAVKPGMFWCSKGGQR